MLSERSEHNKFAASPTLGGPTVANCLEGVR